ncbi:MAG: M3 family oligoendopeptidase [Gorillibacterium sp.]|nr:M3 family oligoendopeptidase [Gorillibacterium sp.]
MHTPLNPVWNLDSIFPGGSSSIEFKAFLDELKTRTEAFRDSLEAADAPNSVEAADPFRSLLEELQVILKCLRQAESFTGCLAAENQSDRKAVALGSRVQDINATYQSAMTLFDRYLSEISEDVFTELTNREPWSQVQFVLHERRKMAQEKLSPELETLAGNLAVDGYHAWGELYNTIVGRVRIPFVENGELKMLSAGQAFNKLHSSDRVTRVEVFEKWEAAWADQADFCADALNHLAGFRLRLYKHRGWESIHQEPLHINRMTQETLDVMWGTVEKNKDIFLSYLARKAKLFGVDQLSWHDVDAPVGEASGTIHYDEGAEAIVTQFRAFSPKLADFAAHALENRWIEAEDRPGKRPGGFCTSFPVSGETRIFMTYSGTATNVSTLAHELGHAFHQDVMSDMPALAQEYAMNVAETASTLAETIVSDAAIRQQKEKQAQIALLDDKLQNAVAMFLNIHARFIFETSFYKEREQGMVSVERLNELMVAAQMKAYRNTLSEYHPHFWAAKLHFYATDVPFYNFPYTFGFLFSSGIYQAALREGSCFEDRYIALLRDTGSMTVEELALKHLGVNLQQPEFWQQAIDMSVEDAKLFLELTEDITV